MVYKWLTKNIRLRHVPSKMVENFWHITYLLYIAQTVPRKSFMLIAGLDTWKGNTRELTHLFESHALGLDLLTDFFHILTVYSKVP